MHVVPKGRATGGAKAAPTPGRMTLSNVVRGRLSAKPFRVLLHAIDGVGKSTWAAGAPNPIFVCSEEGTAHLDVARFPTPKAWADVLEAVRVLTNEEHDFKTLVIDTLDWLEPMCWAHTCALGGKSDIESFGYGKGFQAALEHWRALYVRLDAMVKAKGMHTVLIAHSAIKRVDDPQTGPFDRYRIKLHDRASDLAREWVDAVLFARHEVFTVEKNGKMRGKSSGARVMHTRWTAAFDAKNRFDLPDTLPLDWDEFETAARAGEPRASDALRREIGELLPQLPEAERVKAQIALADWAANNPGRLARLLDKVRAKVSLLEEVGEDGSAPPAPAADEAEDDPVPSDRPPADAKDPWGLSPTAEPSPAPPPARPTPRADAPVVEAAQAYTPEAPLRLTAPDQHTTAPAAAFLAESTPKPPEARPSPRPGAPPPGLAGHIERHRLWMPATVTWTPKPSKKSPKPEPITKTGRQRIDSLLAHGAVNEVQMRDAIEAFWAHVGPKGLREFVEGESKRRGADPAGVLGELDAGRLTVGEAALVAEGEPWPARLGKVEAPAPAESKPSAPDPADTPQAVHKRYLERIAAASLRDLADIAGELSPDPRLEESDKWPLYKAIREKEAALGQAPKVIGGKGGEES